MGKNTSVALGEHFESFVEGRIAVGRFKNVSEVIRAGLRLLEEEEDRAMALKTALKKGLDSGTAKGFDPEQHLKQLKKAKKAHG